jgi:hypothetical protein
MRARIDRQCVVCGEPGVQLWTLDNLQKATATYLCWQHSEPLREIMEIAGDAAPDAQVPVPLRGIFQDVPGPGRRETKMSPLLDWTPPPAEERTPPSDEEVLVAEARHEGKTWKEIAETVGTTHQNLQQKYGKKYKAKGEKKVAS